MSIEEAYKILGIGRTTSKEEIRRAYKRMALKYHPDRFRTFSQQAWATRKFISIKEAHDTLMFYIKSKSMDKDTFDKDTEPFFTDTATEEFDIPESISPMDWFFNKIPDDNTVFGFIISMLLLPMTFIFYFYGLLVVALQEICMKTFKITPSPSSHIRKERLASLFINTLSAVLFLPLFYWMAFTRRGTTEPTTWRVILGIFSSGLVILWIISEWVSFVFSNIWRRSIQSELNKYPLVIVKGK